MPISIVISSANEHNSTRLIDVVENISEYLDDDSIKQIKKVYADKSYDTKRIREYLKSRSITDCILHRNFKTQQDNPEQIQQDTIRCGEILCVAQMWVPQN